MGTKLFTWQPLTKQETQILNRLVRQRTKALTRCIGRAPSAEALKPMISDTRQAFTLVEVMIVVAIIGLLAAIAIPNFVRARETAQLNAIMNNLRIVDAAKDQWALEQKQGTGAVVTWSTDTDGIGSYLKGATVKDVVGEAYTLNAIGQEAVAIAPVKLGTYQSGSIISQ